jgi:phosphoenolpyruvate carboxykinase (GTP)
MYHVNWFRRDAQGKFLWPGFGENLRVLAWMLERCTAGAGATETPIGSLPRPADLNMNGLDVSHESLQALFSVDRTLWRKEVEDLGTYFTQFGQRMPNELLQELALTKKLLA